MPAQAQSPPTPASGGDVGCTESRATERLVRARETTRLFKRLASTSCQDEVVTLRQKVVIANMGVARSMARRYRNRGIPLADLEQVAYLGLIKAVERFDLLRDKDFLTFAVPTIRGELKRYFRDSGWAVRPPRRIQELQARISAATEDLSQRHGRSPRPREVAAALHCAEEEVVEALACEGAFAPTSLDAPLHGETTSTVGESLHGDADETERADARIMLGPVIRALSERDRLVVELRFFHSWTQQQIGDEIGVTQMQVSRIISRILTELRATLASKSSLV